jgi:hypothetical protein
MRRQKAKPIVVFLVSMVGLLLAACEGKPASGVEKNREFRGIALASESSSAAADPPSPTVPKVSIGVDGASRIRTRSDGGACGCAPDDPLCSCL